MAATSTEKGSKVSDLAKMIKANERYAAVFDKGNLPRPPRYKVAIVTCLDSRIDPLRMLGLKEGDVNVIRNAGGRVADAMRSLVISQRLLGTKEVAVIHHTDCGLKAFSNEQIRDRVSKELGPIAGQVAAEIDFLPITDLEQSVREDVEYLRQSPLIGDDIAIFGFTYDVHTGRLNLVDS